MSTTTMSSIRSVLIRTCMSNIQKEISQLEHWLINLSDTPSPHTSNPIDESSNIDIRNLTSVVNRIAEQQNVQQHTLNNIVDRLQILEEMREFYVNEPIRPSSSDPWLDNHCVPLQNEIIDGEDTLSEPLYNIHKEDATETVSEASSIHPPSIVPNVPVDKDVVPDIEDNISTVSSEADNARVAPAPVQVSKGPVGVKTSWLSSGPTGPSELIQGNQTQEVKADPTKDEEEVEVEVEQEEEVEEEEEVEVEEEQEEEVEVEEEQEEEVEVEQEEEVEVEQEEEEEVEVEQEEEEEEEGLELEEITYNGVKYYKDAENFIYSINNDEPSENAVGYWKEKTKSIAFYKTK